MPLKSIKVIIDDKPIDALVDSGAQIVLLNKSIFPGNVHSVGEIRVQGIFGDAVTAAVVPVEVKRCNDDIGERGICMLTEPMQFFLWFS